MRDACADTVRVPPGKVYGTVARQSQQVVTATAHRQDILPCRRLLLPVCVTAGEQHPPPGSNGGGILVAAGKDTLPGADALLQKGTALAEGIGEKLTRITQVPDCFVLIGKPGINVSTKAAYESLQLDKISSHPDIDGMIGDIERGDLLAMTQKMGNVFEPGIIEKYPVIGEIKALMESHGALKAMMSGSGPTVFGIFDDREKMEAAAEVLRESRLAKTVFATEVTKAGGNTNDK